MSCIRRHLTYANVMATIAVFLVLGGGTAVALNGTNTVQSDDLGPGAQVKAPDVAANAVGTNKVVNDSLTGADINESSLGRVPSATLGGLGGSTDVGGVCDPESTAFITCQDGRTTLPGASRVLIIGQIRAEPDTGFGNGGGSCRVGSTRGPVSGSLVHVFVNGGQTDVIAISGVTGTVGPGPESFEIECNQTADGIRYFEGHLSLVELSNA
jgi:hypothetical protein